MLSNKEKMEKIAEILEVELGEYFGLEGLKNRSQTRFRLTENGLEEEEGEQWVESLINLTDIINGKYTLVDVEVEFKKGDYAWFIHPSEWKWLVDKTIYEGNNVYTSKDGSKSYTNGIYFEKLKPYQTKTAALRAAKEMGLITTHPYKKIFFPTLTRCSRYLDTFDGIGTYTIMDEEIITILNLIKTVGIFDTEEEAMEKARELGYIE